MEKVASMHDKSTPKNKIKYTGIKKSQGSGQPQTSTLCKTRVDQLDSLLKFYKKVWDA